MFMSRMSGEVGMVAVTALIHGSPMVIMVFHCMVMTLLRKLSSTICRSFVFRVAQQEKDGDDDLQDENNDNEEEEAE